MARLGKARTDRIRYSSSYTFPQPPSPLNTANPLLSFMQQYRAYDGSPVDDIILGIARLDHHSKAGKHSIPLSVTRLYNILQGIVPEGHKVFKPFHVSTYWWT